MSNRKVPPERQPSQGWGRAREGGGVAGGRQGREARKINKSRGQSGQKHFSSKYPLTQGAKI